MSHDDTSTAAGTAETRVSELALSDLHRIGLRVRVKDKFQYHPSRAYTFPEPVSPDDEDDDESLHGSASEVDAASEGDGASFYDSDSSADTEDSEVLTARPPEPLQSKSSSRPTQ